MPIYVLGAEKTRALLAITAIYIPAFILMTWFSGHLFYLGDESLFFMAESDAPGYRLISDYYTSLGSSERPSDFLLRVRNFMFPLYLGLYRLIGIAGMQGLQVIMNALSLWLVFESVRALTRRTWIAGLCGTVLAITPSFNYLALHGLTETLSIFLVCVFIALMVDHFQYDRRTSLYMAAVVVSLLFCIRPIVLPFWIVLVAYCGWCWLRDQERRVWQPLIIMVPLLCQMFVSSLVTGSVTLVSVGAQGISTWFFPAVYGNQEYGRFVGRKSLEAQEGLRRFPELGDKLAYMTHNYKTTIKTYLSLLVGEHLMAGSNYIRTVPPGDQRHTGARDLLVRWSFLLARVFTGMHVVMFIVVLFLAGSGKIGFGNEATVTCYVFTVFLILPAPLGYLQGDRYMVLTEPLWLVAYGSLASLFIERWSIRFSSTLIQE